MAILGDSTITDLSVINNMQVNGLFTKPIIIKSSINGAYNEGIRITKSSNNWAGMVIGCNAGSESGAPSAQGGWFIANDTSNRLIINNTDNGTTNSSIWINTDKTVNIGKASITTLNGATVGSSPKFTDTTYSAFTAATSSAAGATGLVPAPGTGAQDKFLRGNATWATASDIINTLSEGTSAAQAADYVVCQYAGGGTTTKTYYRRPVSKVLDALTKAQVTTALGYTPPTTNTTYTAGTGLSLSGTTFNHDSSITAGTAGTSSATSGATLAVPYVTYNASGHITAAGTHTHTISGFLTSHQTIKQDAITGATGNRFGTCATAAATAAKTVSITAGTPTLEAGLRVSVKFTYANTANSPTLNVNSLGAKNIFHRGAQITSGDNKTLLAGTCDFIYDGTQFHLIGNYHDTVYTHPNTVTAGTAGTSSATSGSTLAVPYVTYNANGHVTAAGTHTHTITGFLASDGTAAAATELATPRAIDGVNFDGSAAITHYGTCSTAAGTAAKTVACTSFTLVTGSRIVVKFTVTNTAANPTLNVNSTGAKAIQYRGSAISAGYLAANRTYEFVYDGTNYQLVGDIDTNTTYSAMTATEATTGTATTARTITAKVLADYVAAHIGITSVTTGSANGTISVDGTDVAVKGLGSAAYTASTAYAAASHNHPSSQVNLMTGYAKPSSTSAIATTDTLNTAIGKLEKALDGKQASGNYLTTTGTAANSSKLGGTAAASYALKTDIPTVWDSDGHLVSPAGWKIWITDEST